MYSKVAPRGRVLKYFVTRIKILILKSGQQRSITEHILFTLLIVVLVSKTEKVFKLHLAQYASFYNWISKKVSTQHKAQSSPLEYLKVSQFHCFATPASS